MIASRTIKNQLSVCYLGNLSARKAAHGNELARGAHPWVMPWRAGYADRNPTWTVTRQVRVKSAIYYRPFCLRTS